MGVVRGNPFSVELGVGIPELDLLRRNVKWRESWGCFWKPEPMTW